MGAAALLAYSAQKKTQMLKNLETAFGGFKIHKWDIKNPLSIDTRLTLNLINPSSQAQTLQSVFLKLYYKNQYVGWVTQNTARVIAAQKMTPLEFAVSLDLKSLVTEIVDIVKNKGQLKGLLMKGFVTASGVEIPIEETIDLAAYDPRN